MNASAVPGGPEVREEHGQQASGTDSALSYVYAVARPWTDPYAGGSAQGDGNRFPAGLEGAVVRTVGGGGLLAVVSSVPASRYGSAGLQEQLEDLGRLEALARTHHSIVEATCAQGTALPMRLATVYRDDERVAAMLRDRSAEFEELLGHLAGHVEIGVKVYADPGAAKRAVTYDSVPARRSPGRAYLARRRAEQRSHQDAWRAAEAAAAELTERASALADARVVHRPQQTPASADRAENIANEAYLVATERLARFHETVAQKQLPPGVQVQVTGPWAPYSFATVPDRQQAPPGSPGSRTAARPGTGG